MKRFLIFPCILCLVFGLLVGVLLPIDMWGEDASVVINPNSAFSPPASGNASDANPDSDPAADPLNPAENFPLLAAACAVNRCLQRQNWSSLATYVHPDLGVTFTPYSTVDPEIDLTFTADQIKGLGQDQTVYTWGFADGRGNPIQLTMAQYFERYVYNKDYTQAPEIGVDRIITGGNALENLAEVYADCRFVDFSFPSTDPVNDGMDWASLKLVFRPEETRWYLVAIVHGEWTI